MIIFCYDLMQQSVYNKLSLLQLGLVIFCTIVAVLVMVFFLTPMMQFGGGPFGMGSPPNIPDDVAKDLEEEILKKESVITFKETFPEYREEFKERYGVEYSIQSRNPNTGNVLALNINYHPMGPPGSTEKFDSREDLQCIPGENMYMSERMFPMMHRGGGAGLFIHESIKTTNCLDDDWEAQMLTAEELLP